MGAFDTLCFTLIVESVCAISAGAFVAGCAESDVVYLCPNRPIIGFGCDVGKFLIRNLDQLFKLGAWLHNQKSSKSEGMVVDCVCGLTTLGLALRALTLANSSS